MISQQGRVIAIDGDDVVVNIGGVSGCPACDAGQGCGAGIFGRLLRDKKVNIELENSINAVDGQSIELGISENGFLRLVFRMYVWPLIAGLTGVIIGFVIATYSGQSALVADLLGLAVGLLSAGLAFVHSRRKLREFPYSTEVHLLETANSPASTNCALGEKQ